MSLTSFSHSFNPGVHTGNILLDCVIISRDSRNSLARIELSDQSLMALTVPEFILRNDIIRSRLLFYAFADSEEAYRFNHFLDELVAYLCRTSEMGHCADCRKRRQPFLSNIQNLKTHLGQWQSVESPCGSLLCPTSRLSRSSTWSRLGVISAVRNLVWRSVLPPFVAPQLFCLD